MSSRHRITAFCAAIAAASAPLAFAQPPEAAGQASAPIDLTGYWVSLITDEWTLRMITPPKGDYRYLPLNDAARAEADTWDPAGEEARGDACKGYAAPAIMRLPSRLHITWQDDVTLRVDIDTGTQTRLFHFDQSAPAGAPSLQGHSVAGWALPDTGTAGGGWGALQVDTVNLAGGYLQKNGVPFSEQLFMTEYYNLVVDESGTEYLVVQIFVDDPVYLTDHWVRSVQFRREANGDDWNPTACSAY